MLSFEMSAQELAVYQGTNPRPADFDQFWDRALAELDATDPGTEFVDATDFPLTTATAQHLYFTGTGGYRVHAKVLRPAEPTGPAVLMFHGYGGEQPKWVDLLPHAARGFTVAALDVREQVGFRTGSQAPNSFSPHHHLVHGLDDGPDGLLYRHVFLDIRRLTDIIGALPEVNSDRIATTGWSQGGGLALVAAALTPTIRYTASALPFLTDYQRAWELNLGTAPYDQIVTWFKKRDPRHLRQDEAFTTLGYIDVQHLAARIRAEVTLFVGLEDQICPPSTQYATYNKIISTKSVRVYPDFGHEDLPGAADDIFQLIGVRLDGTIN
ncbi:acetylxylan esterase [Longispora fulva]|uniref:Cephalosporin-C deacetylase n=1 Tax=Longispora fulva TaxID=619741 RepID=A0A8J7KK82_9ACTN|nr:alpha/beta fold hydrolase [Longispora fulva]MBG6136371.1 cephalosporin-C deacetylase [Longispora fulva]GIG63455.1 acetylxylan esterase [Longispora fulva]